MVAERWMAAMKELFGMWKAFLSLLKARRSVFGELSVNIPFHIGLLIQPKNKCVDSIDFE